MDSFVRDYERSVVRANDISPQSITNIISDACDKNFRRKNEGFQRKATYWWNTEIATLRKETIAQRRRLTRCRRTDRHRHREDEELARWKDCKRKLKRAIQQAKQRAWADREAGCGEATGIGKEPIPRQGQVQLGARTGTRGGHSALQPGRGS
ncbi:hypothetical protein ABEB36_009412 [Hypothenemus hampei]|uniref:Uncharacterized protein n=1 Tax=Hypothenemus hampei TaxID=57062 RepID=A0ABD1EID5_HYPHA